MYVLMREEVEKIVERHCQTSGFAMAQGAEIEPPDSLKMLEEWEKDLASTPEHIENPEQYELMKALGLRD